MTIAQQSAALRAILAEQNSMRKLLGSNPSPEWCQFIAKDLEALEGAYAAIDAIETEE